MIWTAEADALLTERWAAGDSMTKVMEALKAAGHDIQSRNEVAGRKWRLQGKGVVFMRAPDAPLSKKQRTAAPRPPYEQRPARNRAMPARVPPKPRAVTHDSGVDYLKNSEEGCKAILDRRGSLGLHMVCGKLRCWIDGSRSPYCEAHYSTYNNHPQNQRKPHGEVSQAY